MAAARRHLVQHHAERKQIRTRVQRLAAHLLRRHVRDRPHRAAGVCQQRIGGRVGFGDLASGERQRRLCQPEIQNLRPARREKNVGGLDVAMDDALAVRGIEGVGQRPARCRRATRQSSGPRVSRCWSVSPSSSSIAMNGGSAPTS